MSRRLVAQKLQGREAHPAESRKETKSDPGQGHGHADKQRVREQRLPDSVLAQTFDAAAIGIGLVDSKGQWRVVNPALCRILGYSPEELENLDFYSLCPPEIAKPLSPGEGLREVREMEQRCVHKSGAALWIRLTLSRVNTEPGSPVQYLVQIQDITNQRATEQQLRDSANQLQNQTFKLVKANHQLQELARIDPLTSIYNRRVFDERLFGWISVAHRFGRPISLLMIDIDEFKHYNDAFGHADGDEALRTIAKQIQLCCRESDTPTRYGGEEFAVICPETARYGALELAERTRRVVRELPIRHRKLTVSIGAATLKKEANADDLVRAADAALYRAKQLGRDRVCCFD